jgi:hypothetical protein
MMGVDVVVVERVKTIFDSVLSLIFRFSDSSSNVFSFCSLSGTRGYLTIEDFVWCFRSRGGLGKEQADEEKSDSNTNHPATIIRTLLSTWSNSTSTSNRTGTQVFEMIYERLYNNIIGHCDKSNTYNNSAMSPIGRKRTGSRRASPTSLTSPTSPTNNRHHISMVPGSGMLQGKKSLKTCLKLMIPSLHSTEMDTLLSLCDGSSSSSSGSVNYLGLWPIRNNRTTHLIDEEILIEDSLSSRSRGMLFFHSSLIFFCH